jgi:hypothetical protein
MFILIKEQKTTTEIKHSVGAMDTITVHVNEIFERRACSLRGLSNKASHTDRHCKVG